VPGRRLRRRLKEPQGFATSWHTRNVLRETTVKKQTAKKPAAKKPAAKRELIAPARR
jgi:hypothetical protein